MADNEVTTRWQDLPENEAQILAWEREDNARRQKIYEEMEGGAVATTPSQQWLAPANSDYGWILRRGD